MRSSLYESGGGSLADCELEILNANLANGANLGFERR